MSLKKESLIYDVVIIGGGANGSGIAAEAAERGLKIALFEKNDFAYLSANTWDVSGGGNYGYNSVWVNRNKSHFDNLDYHPKNEIDNLTQLLDIV